MTTTTGKRQAITAGAIAALAVLGLSAGHAAWDADPARSINCSICRAESTLLGGDANAATEPVMANKIPTEAKSPVLVELFTSEGCSSCPPADTLLQDLRKKQSIPGARIIALSEHVDYWNRLGWKDPYSDAQYSARQSEYAKSFKNDQVYTPQIVVDGQAEFVGSDRNAAQSSIARAAKRQKANVRIDFKNGQYTVNVTDLPKGARSAEVYAALTESDVASNVLRGENGGRRLTHTAVARQLVMIGKVSTGETFEGAFRPKIGSSKGQTVIAFVQESVSRKVIGVAEVPIGG